MSGLTCDRNDVLDGTSVGAVLEELGGPPRGRCWPCPNPTHAQTGRTPPVSINSEDRLWSCHGCGADGTAVDALVLGHDITVAEAFTRLRERTGLDRRPPPAPPQTAPVAEHAPPDGAAALLAGFVEGRGWRPGVADMFGLRVVTDRWGKPRIRFPFVRGGDVIWHQDRALGDYEPKYLAPNGRPQQPYALDLDGSLETAQDTGECWLVEGLPDVVALGHLAKPGLAPAVIGLPGVQFRGLPQLARALTGLIVAVVADADQGGETMRSKAAHLLEAAGAHVVQVRLPAGVGDIDDLRRHVGGNDQAFEGALLTARHGPGWADLLDGPA